MFSFGRLWRASPLGGGEVMISSSGFFSFDSCSTCFRFCVCRRVFCTFYLLVFNHFGFSFVHVWNKVIFLACCLFSFFLGRSSLNRHWNLNGRQLSSRILLSSDEESFEVIPFSSLHKEECLESASSTVLGTLLSPLRTLMKCGRLWIIISV